MVNWGEASLFWMLIYKATFLPSTKHHLLGYFFHEMTTFRSTANKSPTRILSARCVWESTSSFQKPALILLQVHSKEGSPKNSNPVNTFVRSLIRKLTLKESWPVCAGQMWKVNFTTRTVCTLGQETSLGTMWPESDLVGSWDLGTREYFFKEPPTFPDPPSSSPTKTSKNVFHVCTIQWTTGCAPEPVLECSAHYPCLRQGRPSSISEAGRKQSVRTSALGQGNTTSKPPRTISCSLEVEETVVSLEGRAFNKESEDPPQCPQLCHWQKRMDLGKWKNC